MTWHHCRTLLHGDYETVGPHVKGALFYLPEHLPTPPLLFVVHFVGYLQFYLHLSGGGDKEMQSK